MGGNGELSKAQLPLLGVILCCTSIPPEKRSDLASIASRMGAEHKFDLTSDVTHLIVGDSDTPKYKFVAKEREDVKCLLPSWIEAVRLAWMEGEEFDVDALEKQHTLPTFAGLKICMTGFDDLAYRRKLEDLINDNGGEYRGNLTKDITHLIAKEPSGNKFNYAGQWHIKTVSIEWMWDSLARGMILDEASYSLLLPASERGRDAWVRKTVSTTSLGKRSHEDEQGKPNARKLRRTASAKLSSENSGIWSNIVTENINLEKVQQDEWQDRENPAPPAKLDATITKIQQTSGEQRFKERQITETDTAHKVQCNDRKEGIFAGKYFIVYGYSDKKTSVLQRHLLSHDAVLLPTISSLPNAASEGSFGEHFLLVPHTILTSEIPSLPKRLLQPAVVTDLWVERCLFKKKMLSPHDNILDRPFFRSTIQGFEDLTVSSTAFHDIDLLHVSKIVPLIGAKFSEDLSLQTSILVCYEVVQTSSKRSFAYDHGIPTVTAEWLWDCIREGQLLSWNTYLTQPLRPRLEATDRPVKREETELREDATRPDLQVSEICKPNPKDVKAKVSIRSASRRVHHSGTTSGADTSFGGDSDTTITNLSPKPSPKARHLSSITPGPHAAPLHEISANASPKPSPSPPKPPLESLDKAQSTQEDPLSSLGPAISSLLAHHQRAASNAAERPPIVRRRRKLLGRAPSNLSARSFSRASSIDTMNTDGLGTPIEASNHSVRASQTVKNKKDPFATLRAYAEEAEQAESQGEKEVQMTQLGYEDPDAKAWRDRIVTKMELEGENQPRTASIGVVEDVSFGKMKGIAGRTRAAGR